MFVRAMMQQKSPFSLASESFSKQIEIHVQIPDLSNSVSQKIREEAQRYFESGNCRFKNVKEELTFTNPTLLNPTNLKWQVHYASSPFDGYLPLSKEELDLSDQDNILIRSCQKIFKSLVSSYRNRIESVEITAHLGDALDFCYAESTEKFDVIDASNLPDQLGLANILNAAFGKMHSESFLFTNSTKWTDKGRSIIEYVEGVLCCPLSTIPTVYGLQLANHVELGAPTLCNLQRQSTYAVNFCWRVAPYFRNISLGPSSILNATLEQLSDACHDIAFPRCRKHGDFCGMMAYTPLTYHYVVNSLIQRTGGDRWFTEPKIHDNFRLAKETADAWKKGEEVQKFTDFLVSDPLESAACDGYKAHGTPALRLVLFPTNLFRQGIRGRVIGKHNVHIIDNFYLKREKTEVGEAFELSFLLKADHGLEYTHTAILIDFNRGIPAYVFKQLKQMKKRVENFTQPYPIPNGTALCPAPAGNMAVERCTESLEEYVLKIKILSPGELSGKYISNNL